MQKKSNYNFLIAFVNVVFWLFYFLSALSLYFSGLISVPFEGFLSIVLIDLLSITFLVYYYVDKVKLLEKTYYKIFHAYLAVLFVNFGINFLLQNFIFGDFQSSFSTCLIKQSYSFILSFVFISFAFIMKTLLTYRDKLETITHAQNAKISTELDELKNQINPHFLFNVFNNIYIQIQVDPQKAREMLLKFSDILRYQLYDCVEGKVFVKSEVEFLQNYIELQKMRIANIDIKFEQKGNFSGLMVYPFMFLPFIELAFKKVGNVSNNEKFIDIYIAVVEKNIIFTVKNSENAISSNFDLENDENFIKIKNRLEFFYKHNYELKMKNFDNYFIVELKLYIK
ncbi:MAG TPA: histidine kinase [Bacteroidales bacterium]|jgi:sensor histidine kinase YesM|nr:histidine kinase [Bacteroidales bacterium]